MNILNKIIAAFFLVFASHVIFAQNLNHDMVNIQKVYSGNKAVSVNVKYQTHLNEVGEKPLEELSGVLCYQNGMTYSKIDSVENFQNSEYTLLVDHNSKVIIKNYLTQEESEAFKLNSSSLDFSSFTDGYKVQKFHKESSVKAYYILISKSDTTEQISIYYNPKNFNVYEVQIKSLQQQSIPVGTTSYIGMPILRIVYTSQSKIKKKKDSFFTDTKYLRTENGKEVATKPYSDYQVITNK
tara:strand:+ start:34659 stop:35378 length:720 start_codon:yes stop_codon:yes gene_type:complete